VGNVDICPTLVETLGLARGTEMEGRVLREALLTWEGAEPEWTTREEVQRFSARGREWQQRLWFEVVGGSAYLAGGTVE
jgi:hypothetical protein